MTAHTEASSDIAGGDARADAGDLLEARNLEKSFGAVRALQDLSLSVPRGEITGIVGDNGAGKSTLIRCLTGVHRPDSGRIVFDGRTVQLSSPEHARRLGVETVYQELALVEDLQVWQNLYLNRELTRAVPGLRVLNKRKMISEASRILDGLDVDVPSVRATVRRMSGGQRQSIAIARAVTWGTSLVIMDEPAAALGVRETRAVEVLIAGLRERGVTVILISHDMDQVMRLADGIWVLRRGHAVAHRRAAATSGDELVGLITGALGGDQPDGNGA
jgi:D-xylose transport system ATP-binding protein